LDQIPEHIDPLFIRFWTVQQNFAAKKNRTKMAGKPNPMSQIKQLMILYKQGKGRKTIARILGISKKYGKDVFGEA
jgi:hypothetical protein